MDILFRSALVVSDGLEIAADLAVKDGIVKAIGELDGLSAKTVVDCAGKLLLPGAVDLGLNLLGGGAFDPESSAGFAHATRDAALGGVTTLISTMEWSEQEEAGRAIRAQVEADGKKSCVDFGYHALVSDWNDARLQQAREAIAAGVPSFWLVRTGRQANLPAPALLFALLQTLPEDALVLTSPWDSAVGEFLQRKAAADGSISDAEWKNLFPEYLETAFLSSLPSLAATGLCRILVNGVSAAGSLGALAAARERCPRIAAAAQLPHLYFQEGDGVPRTWPPIRGKADQQAVYTAIEEGLVSVITSGHKPRTNAESGNLVKAGKGCAAGVGSLAHFLPLLHSEGVLKWRLTLAGISLAACADPAKLAGVYPRKGALQVGSDADIVVFDPNAQGNPSDSESYSPLNFADPLGSVSYKGAVTDVYLRGRRIVENGILVESPSGCFLARRMSLR